MILLTFAICSSLYTLVLVALIIVYLQKLYELMVLFILVIGFNTFFFFYPIIYLLFKDFQQYCDLLREMVFYEKRELCTTDRWLLNLMPSALGFVPMETILSEESGSFHHRDIAHEDASDLESVRFTINHKSSFV